MSVGSIVDHAVVMYRHWWRPFVLLALLWWIPSLASSLLYEAGPVNRALADPSVWLEKQDATVDAGTWVGAVLDVARWVLMNAAFTLATLSATRGSPISAARASLVALVLLESRGPIASLQRSALLVSHRWFFTAGVTALAFSVIGVVLVAPDLIIETILGWLGITQGLLDQRLVVQAFVSLITAPFLLHVVPVLPI